MILFGNNSTEQIAFALCFGTVFGFIYEILSILQKSIAVFQKRISEEDGFSSFKKLKRAYFADLASGLDLKISHIFDYVFTVIFGICYLILQYIASDGVPRLYILFSVLAAFFFVRVIFKRYISGFFYHIAGILCATLTVILFGFKRIAAGITKCRKKEEKAPQSGR